MKSTFKKSLLMAMLCSGQAMAQQIINQTLTINSNGVNSTEILMKKQDNASYYSLFSNYLGFGFYNSNTNNYLFYVDANDRVGIGTQNPLAKLDIRNGSILVKNLANTLGESVPMITQSINFRDYTTFGTSINTFTQNDGNNSYALQFFTQEDYLKGLVEKMRISAEGNVGIGTATPSEKLSVNGAISAYGNEQRQVLTYLPANYNEGDIVSGSSYKWYSDVWTIGNIRSGAMPTGGFGISLNNNMNFKILPNGDVGIGTTTPKEKLSVNGKIRAKEIKVEASNWPDYVFEEGYQSQSLEEIEQFIKANKHLPGVPSAKQVEQDGIELGEMNKILLKKVEELTLLLIEKDKELKKEKEENNARLNEIEKWIKNKK